MNASSEAVQKAKIEEAVLDARLEILGTNLFFGGFAARLKWVFSKRFPTAATDGKSIYLNPNFVGTLLDDPRKVKGLILHEIGHPALGHSLRKKNRDHRTWNLACDYALNAILLQDGLVLPPGALLNPNYDGMSAEEIYSDLMKNGTGGNTSPDDVLDTPDGFPGGKGKGKGKGKSKPQPKQDKQDEQDEQDGELDSDEDGEQDGSDREKQGKGKSDGNESDSDEEQDGDGSSDGEQDDEQDDEQDGDGDGSADESSDDEDEDDDAGNYGDGQDDDADESDDEVILDPAAHQEGQEAETLDPETEWRITVANLTAMAKRAGQMGAGLAAEIDKIKESSVDWKAALAHLLESIDAAEDNSWARPDRRLSGSSEFLFPGEFSEKVRDLVVHLDTSGSVFCGEAQAEFFGHFNDLVKARNFRKVYLIHVDTRVCHVEEFDPAEGIHLEANHKSFGGGGTCFAPSLVWLKDHEEVEPAAIIYLTDMCGSFPTEEQTPNFPMIWLNTSTYRSEVPEHLAGISTVINVDPERL